MFDRPGCRGRVTIRHACRGESGQRCERHAAHFGRVVEVPLMSFDGGVPGQRLSLLEVHSGIRKKLVERATPRVEIHAARDLRIFQEFALTHRRGALMVSTCWWLHPISRGRKRASGHGAWPLRAWWFLASRPSRSRPAEWSSCLWRRLHAAQHRQHEPGGRSPLDFPPLAQDRLQDFGRAPRPRLRSRIARAEGIVAAAIGRARLGAGTIPQRAVTAVVHVDAPTGSPG
jgi:hypothetical protein